MLIDLLYKGCCNVFLFQVYLRSSEIKTMPRPEIMKRLVSDTH